MKGTLPVQIKVLSRRLFALIDNTRRLHLLKSDNNVKMILMLRSFEDDDKNLSRESIFAAQREQLIRVFL